MTDKQKELKKKHGTPEEFRAACLRAYFNLEIDEREYERAVAKYEKEWKEAGYE